MFIPVGDNVRLPTRGTDWSCGYDLYMPERVSIPPFQAFLVDLRIKTEIPPGFHGTLHLRSSAWNVGVVLLCGVIGAREAREIISPSADHDFFLQIPTTGDRSVRCSETFQAEET